MAIPQETAGHFSWGPGIFAASKRIEWDPLDGNRNSFDKGAMLTPMD